MEDRNTPHTGNIFGTLISIIVIVREDKFLNVQNGPSLKIFHRNAVQDPFSTETENDHVKINLD
jgi:hypothetical protein